MLPSSRTAAAIAWTLALSIGAWSTTAESYELGIPVWHERDFRQTLHMSLPGSDQPGEIELVDEIRVPGSEEYRESSVRADMNFRAYWDGRAGRDRLVLGGYPTEGELVIERWIVERPGAQVPDVGEPQPVAGPGLEPGLGFRIDELFRGGLEPRLVSLSYDFEGRFVLALMRNEARTYLYRFDVRSGVGPRVLLDSNDLPQLAGANSLGAHRHRELGRILVLDDEFPYRTRIVLVDTDNDGEFDGDPIIGDAAFYEATELLAWGRVDSLIGPAAW